MKTEEVINSIFEKEKVNMCVYCHKINLLKFYLATNHNVPWLQTKVFVFPRLIEDFPNG